MSKLQIKKQKAQRKGHYPHKINGVWHVIYSAEYNSDIYGPFVSKREAINIAYHNSLQKKLVMIVTITHADGTTTITKSKC